MRRSLLISSRCAQTIYAQRRALALAARRAGWDVLLAGDVVADDPYPTRIEQLGLDFTGLPVQQKSKNPLSIVGLFLAYLRLFRRAQPAVFHAFTIKPTVVGLLAAAVSGVPVRVATIAGLGHVFLSSSLLVRRAAILLFRLALARAHTVIFYNPDDRVLFEKLGLIKKPNVLLIPGSGVDTHRFQPPLVSPAGDSFTVLFIGRLLNEKGVRELLDAALRLRAREPRVRIELLGDLDPNNPSSLTASEVEEALLGGNIHWHGATDDVRPYIANAHVVVLPSYREGIPLSLIEGAAMGRALIATDVPGCRDVVRHGVTGLVVPARDSTALANAIAQLASDPETAAQMGEAARDDAEARFSATVVTRLVLDEYDRLLASRGYAAARNSA